MENPEEEEDFRYNRHTVTRQHTLRFKAKKLRQQPARNAAEVEFSYDDHVVGIRGQAKHEGRQRAARNTADAAVGLQGKPCNAQA